MLASTACLQITTSPLRVMRTVPRGGGAGPIGGWAETLSNYWTEAFDPHPNRAANLRVASLLTDRLLDLFARE